MTSTSDFPTTGVELRYLIVVSDYARSLAFYRDVLGATVVRQISDVLGLLNFGGSELSHCLTGNLPLSASSISFPPIRYWSLLQDRTFAHLLWSSRRTWHSLERKRKMFHEANGGEVSVASAHRSLAARFQRRGAWKSR